MNDRIDTAPPYRHGSTPRAAVLLVNLGTPDAPTTGAVRRYLAEFLWDPRVIEFPRLPWWLILHGVILRVRPARSARNYAKVWTEAGSPLLVHSRGLAEGLQSRLAAEGFGEVLVDLAMSYGNPSIPAALERLREAGVQRLLLLPMYPQYSNTTTGSIFERITRELARWRWLPELRIVNQYWEDAAWLDAVADSVAKHWEQHGRKHLLFSFHSIPKRYFTGGDPYHCFCQGSARRVAARLGLGDGEWSVGFQSRFGREEWLRPYVDELLLEWARGARRKVTVVCPGFATDCLETLEEIAMQNQEAFRAAGGEAFDYVPALNDSAAHVAVMAALVRRHAGGWPEFDQARDPERAAAERAEARAHALRLGAPD